MGTIGAVGLVVAVLFVGGCGGDDAPRVAGTGGATTCAMGSEGCACYGNGTCDGTLTCASDLCVDLGGTGGAAGVAGGAGGVTGGAGGVAGASPAGGASGATPTGGASGVSAGGGGAVATGGGGNGGATIGTGGAVGTGGATAPTCMTNGTECTSTPNACCSGICTSKVGDPAQRWVCAAECFSNGACLSGCCATLVNTTKRACMPRGFCPETCVAAGAACTNTADCCANKMCVTMVNGTNLCADLCTLNSQCVSGCCALVPGTSSKVCAALSNCL